MITQTDILLLQLSIILFATLARFAYYGYARLGRYSIASSWGELLRIGSDLCLMSFGAIAAAMLNPNSQLSTQIKVKPVLILVYLAIFIVLYSIAYYLYKDTVNPIPTEGYSWEKFGRQIKISVGIFFGSFALVWASSLAGSL